MDDNRKSVNRSRIWPRAAGLAAVFAILASLAMTDSGKIFGYRLSGSPENSVITPAGGGRHIVNTTAICQDITGYGGNTPVEIYLTDGVIDSVKPLPNMETPGFFSRLEKGGLFDQWRGMTATEAAAKDIDAISGATFSSKAIIENVRKGAAAYAARQEGVSPTITAAGRDDLIVRIAVFAVLLAGAVVPLFHRGKIYRTIQEIANVAVLGFWGGTFIDYAMMEGFFINHYSAAAASTLLLLFVGMLYPILGRPAHYCTWICPYGSLQELCGRLSSRKIKLSQRTLHWLETFRRTLWCGLILCLFTGWGAGWIDYEIFTAFIVGSASAAVIAAAVVMLLISVFIPRPFCRFICPTGSLLKTLD